MDTEFEEAEFNDLLLEAIEEAMSTLGETAKAYVYSYLERKCGTPKRDIPNKLEVFSDALESIFGVGARQLELLIMKSLHSKLSLTLKWPSPEWPLSRWVDTELTFVNYVFFMRQKLKAHTGVSFGVIPCEKQEIKGD